MDATSPWITRFAGLVPPGAAVLDVAAGAGRHSRLFVGLGHPVTAVDRDVSRLVEDGRPSGPDLAGCLEVIEADLETGGPFPLAGRRFGGVVVANYLHRPLLAVLVAAVAPGGVLLYDGFAAGNERFGRPRRPEFLLRPGELLEAVAGELRVVAYEDLVVDGPRPAARQRIAAVRAP